MKTAPYGAPEQDEWDDSDEQPLALAARPRRRLGGPAAAVLLALLVGAICFYVGIRVEKGQLSSSSASSGGGTGSRLAALLSGRGTAAAGGGGTAAGGGASGSGAAGGGGGGGFGGGGFARALGGGGNSSVGTISSVNGKTLYLTDLTGNTVKVTLSSATTITKSLSVSSKSVHPGDTVVVSGLKGSDGTISATTVNDTGTRGGGGSGSGSSSGSSSASSAVSSLFGGG